MSAPAVVIRLAIEYPVSVYMDAANDGERARLLDWINSRDELAQMVSRALELAEEARAA